MGVLDVTHPDKGKPFYMLAQGRAMACFRKQHAWVCGRGPLESLMGCTESNLYSGPDLSISGSRV